MSKKVLICLLITVMVAALGTYSLSYADSAADKQQELNEINDQKEEVEGSMEELVSSIESQQAEVDEIQASMDQKQREIEQAQADIEKTVAEMEERQDGLDKRLRTMYKNGSVGYLDVLLGSNSLSEFLSNLEMIQRIYQNDQEILETLEKEQAEL